MFYSLFLSFALRMRNIILKSENGISYTFHAYLFQAHSLRLDFDEFNLNFIFISRMNLLNNNQRKLDEDGLNAIDFRLIQQNLTELFTHIFVEYSKKSILEKTKVKIY